MSRTALRRKPSPKSSRPLPPNLPQHNLPEPYARLLLFGKNEPTEQYEEIAALLRANDAAQAAARLTQMALDETYYDYYDFYEDEEEYFRVEPRLWTRLHAVRVLMRLGEAAQTAVEPLLPLLDEEDDDLREEMPFFYGAMGPLAVEPLARLLNDQEAETFQRAGAADSLQEIAAEFPELRARIVSLLEQTLIAETEDETVNGFLITNLLDLGARESLPIIEQAYEEERVDLYVVDMGDVEEHFGLPRSSKHRRIPFDPLKAAEIPLALPSTQTKASVSREERDEAPQTPYVATEKVGRNEPCPCGSGKKYKKCCGG